MCDMFIWLSNAIWNRDFFKIQTLQHVFCKEKNGIWVVDQLLTLDIYVTKQFGRVKGTKIWRDYNKGINTI